MNYETIPQRVEVWIAPEDLSLHNKYVVTDDDSGPELFECTVVCKGEYVVSFREDNGSGYIEVLSEAEFAKRFRPVHICPTYPPFLPQPPLRYPASYPYLPQQQTWIGGGTSAPGQFNVDWQNR